MADLKDVLSGADGVGQRAALAAGKEMARRALEDIGLSDEEKAARDQQRQAARKKTLIKLGVVGVVGVLLVLSLMSVLAKLWMYGLGLLVVAGVGGAGWFALKPKIAALKQRAVARLEAKKRAEEAERLQLEAAAREKAAADARAAKERKLEDELAALKRKAGA